MEKIRLEQAIVLVSHQDAINRMVDPHWRAAEYPYLRGMVAEAVEAMDHYGWKWWAKQSQDVSQFQFELIDILNFSLSHHISESQGGLLLAAHELVRQSNPDLASYRFNDQVFELQSCDVPRMLELLAALAVCRINYLPLLEVIFRAGGFLEWDDVVAKYRQKHALHVLRQRKGYKAGRYIKLWGGEEDSVHLARLVARCSTNELESGSDLYGAIESLHARLTS